MEVVSFLHEHLQQYGDPEDDILKAVRYACSLHKGEGGFVLMAREGSELLGATVINHTGMSGYIPENILVYIAVKSSARGKGVGKGLMQRALSMTKGNVALHVEPDNPAKKLYEKLGFTNKYLEMRYEKK